MHDINVIKSTKLFYKEYPYKISYKRLYGFPSHTVLKSTNFSFLLGSDGYNNWWGDIPANDDDRQRRQNCYSFLKSIEHTKFMNSSFTHVYFKTKKQFEKASKRYTDLQCEHYIPILENLAEVINGFKSNIDLKKSLFHKRFRYKVDIRFNRHLEEKLGPSLYDMYRNNSNYHLNPNMQRFDPLHNGKRMSHSGYAYTFRHSAYNTYAIYCREKIDMEMLTFVAGENIAKITKAVLIDELDK
jgi:hypothetical protein